MAYSEMQPIGGLAEDFRAGLIAAAILNVNRGKNSKPVGPFDLIPWRQNKPEPEKPMSPEELARAIKLHIFHVKPEDL